MSTNGQDTLYNSDASRIPLSAQKCMALPGSRILFSAAGMASGHRSLPHMPGVSQTPEAGVPEIRSQHASIPRKQWFAVASTDSDSVPNTTCRVWPGPKTQLAPGLHHVSSQSRTLQRAEWIGAGSNSSFPSCPHGRQLIPSHNIVLYIMFLTHVC